MENQELHDDYIEKLSGADDDQQEQEQGIDLGRLSAGNSSKPQRRLRPAARSLPQRSKSAILASTAANTTLTSGTAASTHGRPPLRHRSGDLPHARHRENMSKSTHTTTDDWFDFDSAPTPAPAPIPKHSTTSIKSHASDDSGELDGPSFHSEENRRGIRVRERRELVRAISERRLPDAADMGRGVNTTDGSRSRSTKSGVARSGANPNQAMPNRGAPSRSELMSSRRESMKALYRSNHDESPGLQPTNSADNLISRSSTRRRHAPAKTSSGLEAGALAAVMDRRHGPTRSRSTDSAHLIAPTPADSSIEPSLSLSSHDGSSEHDPKWLERRQHKQDQIMTLAHDVKERFADAREKQEEQEYNSNVMNSSADLLDFGDDEDDDQPMAMRSKKTVLQQLKKVANKTGAGARSLGKGTVNAIHDPKLAAKRLGHLSKDVGKATIKTALDPSKLAKGAKNVTVGSAKMGAGITKGVATTAFGATKTVVKGSVNATTKSAMLTMKGTKKVVKGTVRAVKGGHHKHKHDTEEEYNNRNLADRNQASLYDRIASMVENTTADEDEDHLEEAILAGIAAAQSGADPHNTRSSLKGGTSILVPTNLVASSNRGNWDV